MDDIIKVDVLENYGLGCMLLSNGLNVIWDDNGLYGILFDVNSSDSFIILDETRNEEIDEPISYLLKRKKRGM